MQRTNQAIVQDNVPVHQNSKNIISLSSVSEVECYVCGKGLADGCSIIAKTLPNGIVLFCNVHYSLQ